MALLPLHPSMISQITSLCTNPDFSSCVLEILPILTDAYLDVSTQVRPSVAFTFNINSYYMNFCLLSSFLFLRKKKLS